MIPIHILGGLKSIPHSSRTSVYTFIMEVTPPPRALHRVSPLPQRRSPAPNIYSAVPVALYSYTERKQTSADL